MVRADQEKDCKLFIGGLSYETKDDTLKNYFEKWGEIVDSVVMKDPHTRKSRGFGFVTYSEPQMVDAVQRDRPHVIDGREVEPKRAVPREDSDKPDAHTTSTKIFVGGVKDGIEEEDLKEHFSQYGNIEKIEIMYEKDNPSKKRGFAFVTFDDYDPADVCVLKKQHFINDMRCDAKKAISKKDMDEMATSKPRSRGGNNRSRYNDYDYDDDRSSRSRGGNSRMDNNYGGNGRGSGGGGNGGNGGNMGMSNMGMMAKMNSMGMGGMGMGNMGMGGMGMGGMGMGNMGGMGMGNMGGNMGMNMRMNNMGGGNGGFGGNMSNNGDGFGGNGGGNWNRNYDRDVGFDYGNDDFRGPMRGSGNNKSSGPYGGGKFGSRKNSNNYASL